MAIASLIVLILVRESIARRCDVAVQIRLPITSGTAESSLDGYGKRCYGAVQGGVVLPADAKWLAPGVWKLVALVVIAVVFRHANQVFCVDGKGCGLTRCNKGAHCIDLNRDAQA